VAFLLPPVPVLLTVPVLLAVPELLAVPLLLAVRVSEGAFEPQPALMRLIRATSARAARAAVFYSCLLRMWGLRSQGFFADAS